MANGTTFEQRTLRDEYDAARREEIARLMDPATGTLDRRFAKDVACLVCGSRDARPLFTKQGMGFVRCASCSFMYVNPQVDEAVLEEAYKQSRSNDIWFEILKTPDQQKYNVEKYGWFLDRIGEIAPPPARLLDVGCSLGHFLAMARDRGHETLGLELGEKAAAYARETYGLDVRETRVERLEEPDGSFGAVTLFGVLEHLSDPVGILKVLRRLVKPDGVLAMLVPNNHSLVARMLHGEAFGFDGRNHLGYYTKETLALALDTAGFVPVSMTTHVSCINPILNWLHYDDPYFPKEAGNLETEFSRVAKPALLKLIEEHDLGHHLYCIARPKTA